MNPQHPGPVASFFRAADIPVLPLSFSLGVDRGEDGAYHRAGYGHLGQLEGDCAGVTDDAGTDFDQLELQAVQLPLGHFLGQLDAAQEGCEVVGQCVQLQAHFIVVELPA